MLKKIIAFEFRYWKKRWMTYIFPLITFISALFIFTMEGVTIGGTDVLYRNCPNNINLIYIVFSTLLPLFLNSFVGSAITRDYENKFDQILYSTPISRLKLLIGRFIGSAWIISLIFLSILLADIVAKIMPWADKDLLGPVRFDAHLQSFFLLALPNIFIIGSLLLLISSWTKNITKSFLAALVFYMTYQIVLGINDEINNKTVACLVDPYGFIPVYYITKKWSAFEKNNLLFPIDWRYIANRAIWIAVALGLWVLAYTSSKFSLQRQPTLKPEKKEVFKPTTLGKIYFDYSTSSQIRHIFSQCWSEFKFIIRTPVFLILMGMILIFQLSGIVQDLLNDRLSSLANSYNVVSDLSDLGVMSTLILTFVTAIVMWKERDAKMNEIYDTMPTPTYTYFFGKLLAVWGINICIGIMLSLYGIIYQVVEGYTIFDFPVYFVELFLKPSFQAFCIVVLAAFFQVIFNNKYVAFFALCITVIAQPFIFLQWLKIQSNMIGILPNTPNMVYSDFYGYGPYLKNYLAFMLYWLLIYGVLAMITYLFYKRGYLHTFKERWEEAKFRLSKGKIVFLPLVVIALGYGFYIYWQTQVVNKYWSRKEQNKRTALYEKKFKKLENSPNLKVFDADYTIDLEPKKRAYTVRCRLKLTNNEAEPVKEIYINNDLNFPFKISIPNANLISSDSSTLVNFQTYQFKEPIKKGDTTTLEYVYNEYHQGIANELKNGRLMPQGTFIDFSDFTPFVGYDRNKEMEDKSDRDKYGLPVKAENFPKLERNCSQHCMVDELGIPALWTNIHSVISTTEDQMAIAPGSLIKHWKEKGKNYYEYKLDQPSPFFFSIVSGNYEIKRESSAGVQCEVYYLKQHYHNVNEMMKSLKKSIAYYSEHYGTYKHKQARIIEFPRFASFAQAFPGTMPYSEAIGFTSDLVDNPKDVNDIFHVVAHEMAHQWWAHQVSGAFMQGCTLLSESLAEYSSLNLLELEYGRDMMAKFLKESNNGYIFGRASESKKESSLLEQDGQGYIRYQKGSIILYGIQQLLGVETMNKILSNLVTNYAYKEPPYPTAHVLVDDIYTHTPDSLKETFRDGLERIIIFQNNIKKTASKKLPNGMYETSIDFTISKLSSDPNAKQTKNVKDIAIGNSKEAPIRDYFDIALYSKAVDKSRYGKFITSKRFYLTNKENKLTLLSKIKPDKIVIDPYFIHIHKDPEDNMESL